MAYAATSTLGASYLNINGDGGAPQVVESDMVSSMNGDSRRVQQKFDELRILSVGPLLMDELDFISGQ